jgi:nucleoid DNA-binding protein
MLSLVNRTITGGTVNRRDLVALLAEQNPELTKKQVDKLLEDLTTTITTKVAAGEVLSIPGFAKFYRRESKARLGRNPATGETIKIPAKKAAKIVPLKGFKDAVLAGKVPAKKVAVKKPVAKKTLGRTTVKKAPAKKAPVKKAVAKKR